MSYKTAPKKLICAYVCLNATRFVAERRVRNNEKVLELVRGWGCPGNFKLVGRVVNDCSKTKKKKSKSCSVLIVLRTA